MPDPKLDGQRLIAATRLKRNELRIERAIKRALAVHQAKAQASIRSYLTAAGFPDPFDIVTWDNTVDDEVLPVVGEVFTHLAKSVTSFLNLDPEVRSAILGKIDVGSRAESFAAKVRDIGPDLATRITDELTIGAAKGEGNAALGDRLEFVFNIAENKADRIARTETHGAAEAMSNDSAGAIADAGIEVTKTWVATSDNRTRDTHDTADGQSVPFDQPFEVGDAFLMYPGDPDGPVEEVVNCRCSTTYALPEEGD